MTTPFGYAGAYTDAESGLQYLRARYYDPQTAQFLTRDPLLPQTGQAYGYAGQSPLNATDPRGLGCFADISLSSCWSDVAAQWQSATSQAAPILNPLLDPANRACSFFYGDAEQTLGPSV